MSRRDAGSGAAPGSTALQVAIARASAGLPTEVGDLPARARRAVGLADQLGAPRVPVLAAVAAAAQDREDLVRAVEVAAAEGRSVARALVLAPPVAGPLAALLITDAPFAVWATPAGRAVLLVAVSLWIAGGLTVRALVARATSPRVPAAVGPDDELLDLVSVALSAGAGLPHALRLAGAAVDSAAECARVALWFELGAQDGPPHGWEQVAGVLVEARRDGLPLAALVRSLAADRRRAEHHRAMQRAARLGARLTLPTTLLLLPAAGLVVVAPLLHGALSVLT